MTEHLFCLIFMFFIQLLSKAWLISIIKYQEEMYKYCTGPSIQWQLLRIYIYNH